MGCGASTPSPPIGKDETLGLNDPLFQAQPTPDQPQPDAGDDHLSKYAASVPVPTSTAGPAAAEEAAEDTTAPDVAPVAEGAAQIGLQIGFAGPTPGKSIRQSSTASGLLDNFGSLQPSDGQSVMSRVDLGELHAALQGSDSVTEAQFADALAKLLVGADAPPAEVVRALYRAFDTDGSGLVDEKELIAGCQALCSGDEDTKLRLAFDCFDKDGDGHLTPAELQVLLKGTIEPAVARLHAAIDFASFGADDGGLVEAINEEAGDGARIAPAAAADGMLQVELKTKAGVATISVPAAALAGGEADASLFSLDAFLEALCQGALDKYDADKNGMIEVDEFVAFARENPFLSMWFGHLAEGDRSKSSWKDDFVVG